MEIFELRKKDFTKFFEKLSQDVELIAPINKGIVKFETIKKEDVKDIWLKSNSYFPVKEYFFRKHEKIFDFRNKNSLTNLIMPNLLFPKRVFFGLRRCDLNAIMHQDKIFMEKTQDPYYISLRKNSLLIGYHCNEAPSQYCFCGTLNLKDFYDLMFYMKGNFWLVEVATAKGKDLVKKYSSFFRKTNRILTSADKIIKNSNRLLKSDISGLYDNEDWQKAVSQCLSCGACTTLCPTCYCFEFHDELKPDGSGCRIREWSSCQLLNFTRVAGNHIFRQKREERFKHRIYHQLKYFKDREGEYLCVGCGRCISGCPTRIDFVEIINNMK